MRWFLCSLLPIRKKSLLQRYQIQSENTMCTSCIGSRLHAWQVQGTGVTWTNCTPRPSHKGDLYMNPHVPFCLISLSALTPRGTIDRTPVKRVNDCSAPGKEEKGWNGSSGKQVAFCCAPSSCPFLWRLWKFSSLWGELQVWYTSHNFGKTAMAESTNPIQIQSKLFVHPDLSPACTKHVCNKECVWEVLTR